MGHQDHMCVTDAVGRHCHRCSEGVKEAFIAGISAVWSHTELLAYLLKQSLSMHDAKKPPRFQQKVPYMHMRVLSSAEPWQ